MINKGVNALTSNFSYLFPVVNDWAIDWPLSSDYLLTATAPASSLVFKPTSGNEFPNNRISWDSIFWNIQKKGEQMNKSLCFTIFI